MKPIFKLEDERWLIGEFPDQPKRCYKLEVWSNKPSSCGYETNYVSCWLPEVKIDLQVFAELCNFDNNDLSYITSKLNLDAASGNLIRVFDDIWDFRFYFQRYGLLYTIELNPEPTIQDNLCKVKYGR